MVEFLIAWLEQIATNISLELFVVVGAFLEEIIAPIPSPFVMATAAVIAKEQNYMLLQLAFVILIGAIAKTASTYVVYVAADKAEDVLIGKMGKYVGIDHSHIEKIGNILRGTWWDDVLLFLSRAIPLVPTFPISAAAGVIKYNLKSYILLTFIGSIIRNVFYLWIGYFGYAQIEKLWNALKEQPVLVALILMILVVSVVAVIKLKDYLYEIFLEKNSSKSH